MHGIACQVLPVTPSPVWALHGLGMFTLVLTFLNGDYSTPIIIPIKDTLNKLRLSPSSAGPLRFPLRWTDAEVGVEGGWRGLGFRVRV